MTNAELKEFFEIKFSSIDDKIASNHSSSLQYLQSIEAQTIRTNGRVTSLETRVNNIVETNSNHFLNCPRIKEIEGINKEISSLRSENELIRLVSKNPKLSIGVIVGAVILTLWLVGYSMLEMHSIVTEIKTEQK